LTVERVRKLRRYLSHRALSALIAVVCPVAIFSGPLCQRLLPPQKETPYATGLMLPLNYWPLFAWRNAPEYDKDKFMTSIIRLITCAGLLALAGCATQGNQGGLADNQSQTTYDSGSSYPPARLGDGP
jgi:hypothetical protein